MLESLPAAIWAFLANLESPTEAILSAVNGGYDADTVAAMTGALAGAYHGAAGFPHDWVWPLEFADGLAGWADAILTMTGPAEPTVDSLTCATSDTTHGWGPIKTEGRLFPTVEHAYRSLTAFDPLDQERIRLAPTPQDAASAARAVVLDVEKWDQREELIEDLMSNRGGTL